MEMGFFMGRRSKYTKEQKVKACEDYLFGRRTASQIAVDLNMSVNGQDSAGHMDTLYLTPSLLIHDILRN